MAGATTTFGTPQSLDSLTNWAGTVATTGAGALSLATASVVAGSAPTLTSSGGSTVNGAIALSTANMTCTTVAVTPSALLTLSGSGGGVIGSISTPTNAILTLSTGVSVINGASLGGGGGGSVVLDGSVALISPSALPFADIFFCRHLV